MREELIGNNMRVKSLYVLISLFICQYFAARLFGNQSTVVDTQLHQALYIARQEMETAMSHFLIPLFPAHPPKAFI